MLISMKSTFHLLVFLLASLAMVIAAWLVVFYLIAWYDHNTITLEEVRAESCESLPDLAELDTWFNDHRKPVSELLTELGSCTNNMMVCKQSAKCQVPNYEERHLRSGNTTIEWKKVGQCGDLNKGALIVMHTSACEIDKLRNFERQYPDFKVFPAQSINY